MKKDTIQKAAGTKPAGRTALGILAAVLVFAFFLTCYVTMINTTLFQDEIDIFSVGDVVARGGDVYKVSVSQHMPVSYYLAALFGLFRPVNMYQYRFYFYTLLSLIWTGMFVKFRKHVSPVALVMAPVIYIAHLMYFEQGTTLLSEHWAGVGHAILLLELISYSQTKRLTWSDCLWISGSILLSFGSTFSSAYSIAMMALGVLAYQVWFVQRTEKHARKDVRRQVLQDDGRLLLCVLTPWALLLIWYAISGNLQNFFYSVYGLNVELYSQYTGGFGTDPWGSFVGMFSGFRSYLISSVRDVFAGDLSMEAWHSMVAAVAPVVVSIALLFVHPFVGIAYFCSSITTALRGFENYHAMHFVCAGALATALILGKGGSWIRKNRKNVPAYVALLCGLACFVFLTLPVFQRVPLTMQRIADGRYSGRNEDTKEVIDVITDPQDPIHFTAVNGESMELDRTIDYGCASSTPWTWEAFGDREVSTLSEKETKVVLLEDIFAWGYERDEYAADLIETIHRDYYPLSEMIWIRRSYLNEAVRRMVNEEYDVYIPLEDPVMLFMEDGRTESAAIGEGAQVEVVFPETVQLDMVEFWPDTEGGKKQGDLMFSITDAQGQTIYESTVTGKYLVGDEMNLVFLEECTLEGEETYILTLRGAGEDAPKLMLAEVSDEIEDDVTCEPRWTGEAHDGMIWKLATMTSEVEEDDWEDEWEDDWEDDWDDEDEWEDEDWDEEGDWSEDEE
ncbi:MAG: hypothetical protein IJ083_03470 [Clostridia bacterium]|nr:hypothetical protein [Clostridia bacterium]